MDIDLDDDIDIIVDVWSSSEYDDFGGLVLIENMGSGSFVASPRRIVNYTEGFYVVNKVQFVDIDNDGEDLDIIVAYQDWPNNAGYVSWFRNDYDVFTDQKNLFTPRPDLHSQGKFHAFAAGDFNDNGNPDLFLAEQVYPFWNITIVDPLEDHAVFSFQVPAPSAGPAVFVYVLDVNLDGRLDIVIYEFRERIRFLENIADGEEFFSSNGTNFADPVEIFDITTGDSNAFDTFWLVIEDFNNDNTPDFVVNTRVKSSADDFDPSEPLPVYFIKSGASC